MALSLLCDANNPKQMWTIIFSKSVKILVIFVQIIASLHQRKNIKYYEMITF